MIILQIFKWYRILKNMTKPRYQKEVCTKIFSNHLSLKTNMPTLSLLVKTKLKKKMYKWKLTSQCRLRRSKVKDIITYFASFHKLLTEKKSSQKTNTNCASKCLLLQFHKDHNLTLQIAFGIAFEICILP